MHAEGELGGAEIGAQYAELLLHGQHHAPQFLAHGLTKHARTRQQHHLVAFKGHWQEACQNAAAASFGRLLQPLRSTDTTAVTISSENCCVEKREASLPQRWQTGIAQAKGLPPSRQSAIRMAWRRTRTVSAEERRLLSTVMADEQNTRRRSSGAGLFFFGSNRQKTIILGAAEIKKTAHLSRTANPLFNYHAGGSLF